MHPLGSPMNRAGFTAGWVSPLGGFAAERFRRRALRPRFTRRNSNYDCRYVNYLLSIQALNTDWRTTE